MKHIHHIVPKYLGGTDEESNLIELTVEEHAEAHRILYEKYGRWEDKLAWQGLAGLINKEEIISQVLSQAASKGGKSGLGKKRKPYNWKNKTTAHKHLGTNGSRWYHNPNDVTQKGCFKEGQKIPDGWIRGQGKKSKNPGLNFTAKKSHHDGGET